MEYFGSIKLPTRISTSSSQHVYPTLAAHSDVLALLGGFPHSSELSGNPLFVIISHATYLSTSISPLASDSDKCTSGSDAYPALGISWAHIHDFTAAPKTCKTTTASQASHLRLNHTIFYPSSARQPQVIRRTRISIDTGTAR